MKSPDLQDHLIGSYTAMRLGVAVLGLGLPAVLVVGGAMAGLDLQTSLSAYYHAGEGAMRDWFVGVLFAVSGLLVFYRGFTRLENWALDIGGLALAGVALVPMDWECGTSCEVASPHGALAITFFVSLAYVCWRRAPDTIPLILEQGRAGSEERAARYLRVYRLFGALLLATPLTAWGLSALLDPASPSRFLILTVEVVGIAVFAGYWIVKSREIRETHADRLAAEGLLQAPETPLAMAFRAAPVALQDLGGGDRPVASGPKGGGGSPTS